MEVPFYRSELSRDAGPTYEGLNSLDQAIDLLTQPELRSEILSGNITVAMVRPSLEGNTSLPGGDEQVAEAIESNISDLAILAKFSVTFDDTAVEDFYGGGPKEVQLDLPPERFPEEYENRWQEFKDLMVSGPSTVLILHQPRGGAIATWRKQVGHFDIVKNRDEATIRGKFGTDNYNNLVHGSDSIEAASREVSILSRLLLRELRHHGGPLIDAGVSKADQLDWLVQSGLLADKFEPFTSRVSTDWSRNGETYTLQFQIKVGEKVTDLVCKACIVPPCTETMDEWMDRRSTLTELGLNVPKLYDGPRSAAIIEESIPYRLKDAYNNGDESVRTALKGNFIHAFKVLVANGFRPIGLHDLRSHGEDIVFIDFGYDLGGPSSLEDLDTSNQANIEDEALKQFNKTVGIQ